MNYVALSIVATLVIAVPATAQQAPLVLAAASLQESMTAAADAWAKRGHPKPVISFAASSALARQVEAGAPADLFVSADEDWMNDLARKSLIVAGTRVTFLGNRLVVAAPAGSTVRIPVRPPVALAKVLTERRKELLMRGLRWTDLRRLNRDSRFAVTLSRTVQGQEYLLPPGDPRYTLLIPNEVIVNSGIAQNSR